MNWTEGGGEGEVKWGLGKKGTTCLEEEVEIVEVGLLNSRVLCELKYKIGVV